MDKIVKQRYQSEMIPHERAPARAGIQDAVPAESGGFGVRMEGAFCEPPKTAKSQSRKVGDTGAVGQSRAEGGALLDIFIVK